MTMPVDSLEISLVGPLMEKYELDQTKESDNEVEKSDAVNVEVSEQVSDEAEHQVAELDDQLEKLDVVSVGVSLGVSDQDSNPNEAEHQVAELDDQLEKLDVVSVGVSVGVSDQDSNSNKAKHHSESNDEINKSDSVIFQVSVQDPKRQMAESHDEIAKSDVDSVEVSEQDPNEGEDQEAKLDAVNVKVNEEPTVKWDEDYPPLPTSSSRKVNNNIVAVKSRKEVPNIKNVESVPFRFLMKILRLEDASIQEQINLAKLQLEEKTRLRDSIYVQIQEKREISMVSMVGPTMEKCELGQTTESDNEVEKSDVVNVELSKQDSDETEHQLGELDDQILDVVSVGVSDQDSNSNEEAEHHATESNDEIKKSDSVIFQVSLQDPKHQTAESNDVIEKLDAENVEVSEEDSDETEHQIEKLDVVNVGVSDQDSNSNKSNDVIEKSDAESVEVSKQDPNEGEDQMLKLDAVNVKVHEEPTVKWDEDYPPLPARSPKVNIPPLPARSPKVNINIVSFKSRKDVPNIKNVESVAEPFSFLMKIPRLDDASIQEQINLVKLQLEEKTRLRDSIQVQIQEKKDNIQTLKLDYESAKDEGNIAKTLVKSKTKQLREESPSHIGSENELHLKILRKELQILKESIATAAAAATEAERKCDAENVKIKQLQVKYRAANEARQSAYVHLQSLKTKLSAKNQQFFQYKDAAAFANNHACSGNKTALHRLCTDQVEKLMELWNTNDEFRQDYVKSNARSTIRRLGTLDGCSLGLDIKPPALPSYPPHQRVDRVDLAQKVPTTVTKEHENRRVTVRRPALNESELTKKAEELLRKEEAEAKLKEQRRLEELAKAEVAREKMKKRQAEKEQKEAEEKEKERLRRLRKKEKKKEKKKADHAAAMDVNNEFSFSETVAAKPSKDDESTVVPKKPQKSQPTKALSVPPALRCNRNKKRSYRQLMWTSLIGLLVYILFWLGNFDVLSKLNVVN